MAHKGSINDAWYGKIPCHLHAPAWSPLGFQNFIDLILSCLVQANSHMTRNYKMVKLGLEKKLLVAIRLHTPYFLNHIGEKTFLGKNLRERKEDLQGFVLKFRWRGNQNITAFWAFLMGGVIGIWLDCFTIISRQRRSSTMSSYCYFIGFIIPISFMANLWIDNYLIIFLYMLTFLWI